MGSAWVRDFVGHGASAAACTKRRRCPTSAGRANGVRLKAGMVLAVEPMVNAGVYDVRILPDRWTVKTGDGKRSAHYENTIAITTGEPIILTRS